MLFISQKNNSMEDGGSITKNGKRFLMVMSDDDQDYWNEYLVHKAEHIGEGLIKYSIYACYFIAGDWGCAEEWSALLTKIVRRDIPEDVTSEETMCERYVDSLLRTDFITLMNEDKQHGAPELVDGETICLEDYKGYFTDLGFNVDEGCDYYDLLTDGD